MDERRAGADPQVLSAVPGNRRLCAVTALEVSKRMPLPRALSQSAPARHKAETHPIEGSLKAASHAPSTPFLAKTAATPEGAASVFRLNALDSEDSRKNSFAAVTECSAARARLCAQKKSGAEETQGKPMRLGEGGHPPPAGFQVSAWSPPFPLPAMPAVMAGN